MRFADRIAIGCLVLIGSTLHAEPPPNARKALDEYYKDRLSHSVVAGPGEPLAKLDPPPWDPPLKQLVSSEAPVRLAAVAYLRELVSLALADEQSSRAPTLMSPGWNGGEDLPSRDVRKMVAQGLPRKSPPAELLPLLKWYLEKEPTDAPLGPVIEVLAKLDGDDVDALRAAVALKPHENALVAANALVQIIARKKQLPVEKLLLVCQHHRTVIRNTARGLYRQQEGKEPPPFDVSKTLHGEAFTKLMDQVQALMPDLPGEKSELVNLVNRFIDRAGFERDRSSTMGWLVRKDEESARIYTPYGRFFELADRVETNLYSNEPLPDGSHSLQVTTQLLIIPNRVEFLVRDVAETRKRGEAINLLSERGVLTDQSRGQGATLYEAILGVWLYKTKRDELAAQILFPALESSFRDEQFVHLVRLQVGELAGQRMLVAFVGKRDYREALEQAGLINKLYPDSVFHGYAKRLADELPRRADDFKTFKLPTLAEWTELKRKLTREQQIDYLCERLRLLNCFQWGQPGGYSLYDQQFAEPCGLSENAAWSLNRGKTSVINPYVELVGDRELDGDGMEFSKGLGLTPKDVPALARHLRLNWYMPIVSFHRDFSHERHLSRTRPLLFEIINSIAHKDICHIDEAEDLQPAELEKAVERITKWAAENAHKTENQLMWEALQERLAAKALWREIEDRIEKLLRGKETKAYDVMKQLLHDPKSGPRIRADILELYLRYDVDRAKDLALPYLTEDEPALRRAAALVVFKTGDKDLVRGLLGDELAKGNGWYAAATALLSDKTPESRKQLGRLFTNPQLILAGSEDRAEILAACAKSGLKEPYKFYFQFMDNYDKQLRVEDSNGKEIATRLLNAPVAELVAHEIVTEFAPEDEMIKAIVKKYPAADDRVLALRRWLQSKLTAK
jgi:hypothetical protein